MNKTFLTLMAASLIGGIVTAATMEYASAQPEPRRQNACLQNNRIWNWRVVDDRTLIVSDRNYRPFLVHLTGGCVGLTNATFALSFRTWTELGCLGQGDRVSFRDSTLGPMSCVVTDVRPLPPRPPGVNEGDLRYYDPRFRHEYAPPAPPAESGPGYELDPEYQRKVDRLYDRS